jgi:hypothetical protein
VEQRDQKAAALIGILLVGLGTVACSGPQSDPWTDAGGAPSDVAGRVGGERITFSEIARYIQRREPDTFARNVNRMVMERVTLVEADDLGITVPERILTRETERRMRAWEKRVRETSKRETGEEIEPALWLQRTADLSVGEFKEQLKEAARIELVQDRLVRYEQLTSRSVSVSMVVVEGEDKAAAVASGLKGGAAFASVAEKHLRDPSAGKDGRIPFPLLELDVLDEKVRQALFAAEPGATLGPFAAGDGGYYQVFRLEAKAPGRESSYQELKLEIARDLEKRPVAVGEYVRWRRRIMLRNAFKPQAAPREKK